MVEEQRYLVHEATLIRRPQGGSMWSLRFRLFDGDLGATTSRTDEIVVMVSPDKVDDMLFAVPYTLAEIGALREGEGEGDGAARWRRYRYRVCGRSFPCSQSRAPVDRWDVRDGTNPDPYLPAMPGLVPEFASG